MAEFEPGERSSPGESIASALIAAYARFCRMTTRWTVIEDPAFAAARAKGPVVLVFWHSRSAMASATLPRRAFPLLNLFARNRDGRISAGVQRRMGLRPIGLSGSDANRTAARLVLNAVTREGYSIGLPGDGHRGPARILQDAPLDWARATGRPIFLLANSVRRQRRLPGWDRLLFPLPFSRGAVVLRPWDGQVPGRSDTAALEEARRSLTAALDAVTAEADKLVGLPPGP